MWSHCTSVRVARSLKMDELFPKLVSIVSADEESKPLSSNRPTVPGTYLLSTCKLLRRSKKICYLVEDALQSLFWGKMKAIGSKTKLFYNLLRVTTSNHNNTMKINVIILLVLLMVTRGYSWLIVCEFPKITVQHCSPVFFLSQEL